MRTILLLVCFAPLIAFTQKIKISQYDKFIKQWRIEFEPLTISSSEKANVSLSYNCTGSTFYVLLSGFGWGASTIGADQQAIFLLSNDHTITVKSTGIQLYDAGSLPNRYNHRYFITLPDIEALSQYELVGIRKYGFNDFADIKVSGEYSGKIKKLSSMFIEELKKAKVLTTFKNINVEDVAKHIGDSVRFCSKVFSTRYFESSANKPTLLDVNTNPDELFSVIIWEQDRKIFGNAPEILYNNKEVCISGVVQLYNNKPQIVLRKREQIAVKTPVRLEEVSMFVGDSVTVRGKIFSSKYISDSVSKATLLNMGVVYPEQLLTVVIEEEDRKNFTEQPENYYVDKEVQVTGQVTLYRDKPQIIIRNKAQISEMATDATASAGAENNGPNALLAEENPKKESEGLNKTAEFPGGRQAWISFLNKHLRTPVELEAGEKKTVIARFLVGSDGSTSAFEIKQSAGRDFDEEVIRVLKKMPKWTPEVKNGQPIMVYYTQPVTFVGTIANQL